MLKKLHFQGFFLLDTFGGSLNNAGKDTSSNLENGTATKTLWKDGKPFVYISGQAFKNWWRKALEQDMGWELSPVQIGEKIVFTAAQPLKYGDDDTFGYMRAAKETVAPKEKGGKPTKNDITVTRKSPLFCSVIQSVAPTRTTKNFSTMSRQVGNSVPYQKEEYAAILRGQFSLNAGNVGVFSPYSKAGFKNVMESSISEYIEAGCEQVEDPYIKVDGQPGQLLVMPKDMRVKRSIDVMKALKTINGGAMQASNMEDVTPKLIILVATKTACHPFGHICGGQMLSESDVESAIPDGDAEKQVPVSLNGRTEFSIPALQEVIEEYGEYFLSKIYIGKRMGFLDEYDGPLKKLAEANPNIVYGPVNKMIDAFCEAAQNLF